MNKTIDQLMDELSATEQALFEQFGYKHDWRIFPLDDRRHLWWNIEGHTVRWQYDAKYPFNEQTLKEEQYCTGEIYTYRHLKKHVFETETHTLALVATGCDGNILLMLFSNANKVVWPEEYA